MPTPLANESIIQGVFEYTQNGQTLLNTFHWRFETGVPAPDYRLVMDELHDVLSAGGGLIGDILLAMSVDVELTSVRYQPVWPTRLAAVIKALGTPGGRAGVAGPQNVAAVISKKTDLATRYGRGNWHQPGALTADQTGGYWTAAYIDLLEAIGDNFNNVIGLATAGDMVPVIWSATTPARSTRIEDYNVEPTVRVMRRRTVLVGI